MGKLADILTTTREVVDLLPILGVKPKPKDTTDSIGRRLEENAEKYGDKPMISFEGQHQTWGEFNALTNRIAHVLKAEGVQAGDCVSLFMENRIEQLATLFAVIKLGARVGLINTNLRGRPLTHCITVTESKKCIVGEELADAVGEVLSELSLQQGEDFLFMADKAEKPAPDWAKAMAAPMGIALEENPAETQSVTLGDTAFYIFTSGTTGLPKAAVVSHNRFLYSAFSAWKTGLKCTVKDRIYLCLPLYHGTGLLIGVGPALLSGASMFVRRKFSASRFLDEVREQNTNCFIYIGELCRYLMHQPARPDDHNNPLERMMGNGLRPDVWMDFKKRFGIKRIAEFYGASEGNVGFVNLLNKDCTIGTTVAPIALVQYSVDEDEIIRNDEGFCIQVNKGEPGLLLSEITEKTPFEGYTNPEATEKKIIRDVFKKGDTWFNTGDMLKQIDVGFAIGLAHYQFVDRIGDTFRWKSENVSTNEIGEILNGYPGVKYCNVYGVEVPGADGKAGMAALVLEKTLADFDMSEFSAYVKKELPSYACPVFLRIQPDIEVTGTFKMVKGELRREGYDVDKVNDPLFILKPHAEQYESLTTELYQQVLNSEVGL